ncbi:MAG: hypothetical protein NTZ87_01670 [Candidatus Nomurabacteria bacterium]|nr:hypothetical protein [Candidatus Nomurabacteria bacterium]
MEKIKLFIESEKGKDIMIVVIVILVGLASFELGRLSKEDTNAGIKIEYPSQTANQTTDSVSTTSANQNTISVGKTFFASSKGGKYYTISCSAGKTIKQENRIYFATGEEAQKAGYTLSSSCN